jgi:hypothetical protein
MVVALLTVKVPTVDIHRSSGWITEIAEGVMPVMPCMIMIPVLMMLVMLVMLVMLATGITMVVAFASVSESGYADSTQT